MTEYEPERVFINLAQKPFDSGSRRGYLPSPRFTMFMPLHILDRCGGSSGCHHGIEPRLANQLPGGRPHGS